MSQVSCEQEKTLDVLQRSDTRILPFRRPGELGLAIQSKKGVGGGARNALQEPELLNQPPHQHFPSPPSVPMTCRCVFGLKGGGEGVVVGGGGG